MSGETQHGSPPAGSRGFMGAAIPQSGKGNVHFCNNVNGKVLGPQRSPVSVHRRMLGKRAKFCTFRPFEQNEKHTYR